MVSSLAMASIIFTLVNRAPIVVLNESISSMADQDSICSMESISRTVPIVAVNSRTNTGVMGNLTVDLVPGNSNILMDVKPYLQPDLQYSAVKAVSVATTMQPQSAAYDYHFFYNSTGDVIGGESAGAAATIATLAALEGKDVKTNVAITGTINPDGSIGPVGGIPQKTKAVADAGYTLFLVPKGQSGMSRDVAGNSLEVREVGSISDAANLMLGM